jgi:hypothetical protein
MRTDHCGLQEALVGADSSAPLREATRCDVATTGGGFVGLWTALRIKELTPGVDVAVPYRLAEIGWTGGDAITDAQTMVSCYRTTTDGRVAFGKGTAGMVFGTRVTSAFDYDARRAGMTAADFCRYHPILGNFLLEYA